MTKASDSIGMNIVRRRARRAGSVTCLLIGAALFIGCGASRGGKDDEAFLRAGLPPTAQVVQEGTGRLMYTPDENGRVYLYDATSDRLIGRFRVRRGQRLAFDPATGRATIAGDEVRIGETTKDATYQIYFVREAVE
ncbi:MAG: hypothetical protein WBD40_19810 [Tepidisphaeraceae bacterium]